MKMFKLALSLTAASLAMPVMAQDNAGIADDSGAEEASSAAIIVTGSRIKRDPANSALPLQIITTDDLSREGISNPEQMIMYLNSNGNGADNLASNADVISTTSAQRGANGASFANLRGQGSASTLVLLNGRRVAAHGLSGSAVDVNQIPFAAIERVEVLKDGASAIYGTDAVGGVINFITKKDYKGLGIQGFVDIPEGGGGEIYRLAGTAGYGDLNENGFNIMGAVSYNWSQPLRGSQRDFVNLFQYDRGLSPETRGSPFGTIVPLAGTILTSTFSSAGGRTESSPWLPGESPFIVGSTTRRANAINVMALPGREGCEAIANQGAHDYQAWNIPNFRYACAWDSATSAYLQQKQRTLTYFGRAIARLGEHEISFEINGSKADATKIYSEVQLTPNTTTQNYAYRRIVGVNEATYDMVYDRLLAAFPYMSAQARGTPIAYRWRCLECGPREVNSETTTLRAGLFAEGPLFSGWDYRAGVSYGNSKSNSVVGGGFYYTSQLIAALNTGIINPFLLPGQTQSQAALTLLQSASAEGQEIYRGKFAVTQADASVSGSLFALPAGDVQMAFGVDYRKEKYNFFGSLTTVYAAPTDNGNNLAGVSREIKAAYTEVLVPILDSLEVTGAVRVDDYSGFGTTTNPKVSVKFRPIDPLMFRGSYNTSFRVPTFNQLFNGRVPTVYTGSALVDPTTCPTPLAPTTAVGCARISGASQISGGNPNLEPETAKQASLGVVFQPSNNFSVSVDWWKINRKNTIQLFTLSNLLQYYSSLSDRFTRDSSGAITAFDLSWTNAGLTKTQALEIAVRGGIDAFGGRITAGMDGTYLLKKKERVVDAVPYDNKIGVFSLSGDLGLRWKHNAYLTYSNDEWTLSLSQIFRNGYKNRVLPGVLNGTAVRSDIVYDVDDYIIYNASIAFTGIEGMKWTLGVKNLFDTDPPFAISYDDNTGGGSSWEPRVADPRGRSMTINAEMKF